MSYDRRHQIHSKNFVSSNELFVVSYSKRFIISHFVITISKLTIRKQNYIKNILWNSETKLNYVFVRRIQYVILRRKWKFDNRKQIEN